MTAAAASRITLDWPDDPAYRPVGRLVLGGVAARLDVPVDRVDELGLVLDSLARAPVTNGRLQLEIDVEDGRLVAAVGTFTADPLAEPAIRRVVAPLVDKVESAVAADGFRTVLTLVAGGPPG